MISDKIKILREQKGLTQAALAKKLGITRSSVNAWEMGISVPSTQYVVEFVYATGSQHTGNHGNKDKCALFHKLIFP